jgi:hypothetical protein
VSLASDVCGPFGKDCHPTVVGTVAVIVAIAGAAAGYFYFWMKFKRK